MEEDKTRQDKAGQDRTQGKAGEDKPSPGQSRLQWELGLAGHSMASDYI